MSYEFVKTSNEDGIIRVTLNSPPLNVITFPMMGELVSAFTWAGKEKGSVIVLDAEGKSFSAGVDISYYTSKEAYNKIVMFEGILEAMHLIDKPIVAVVNGAALGGGYGLVLCCDMVVASEKAIFGQPEVKLGLFPPLACYMLPRLLSWTKAMELLLTGKVFSAEKAEQLGLVNKVLPLEGFAEGVDDYLKQFSALSPVVLALTKKAAKSSVNKEFTQELKDIYNIYLHELMKTEDVLEGVQAFIEKRPPVWRGR